MCVVFIYLYKVEIKYMLQVFGTIKVFKGYSNMRQTEDIMFQQNKYLCKYGEVANGNSNIWQTNMRYTEDNMFQPDKFLEEYAKVVMGYSNIRQIEDNMFQPDKFLEDYADQVQICTKSRVGGIFCCCIFYFYFL